MEWGAVGPTLVHTHTVKHSQRFFERSEVLRNFSVMVFIQFSWSLLLYCESINRKEKNFTTNTAWEMPKQLVCSQTSQHNVSQMHKFINCSNISCSLSTLLVPFPMFAGLWVCVFMCDERHFFALPLAVDKGNGEKKIKYREQAHLTRSPL